MSTGQATKLRSATQLKGFWATPVNRKWIYFILGHYVSAKIFGQIVCIRVNKRGGVKAY